MKFCTKCGKELVDEAVVCIHCGCAVAGATTATAATPVVENDAPSTGFAVLGFFFPMIGLILYLLNMNTAPLKAKSAGKGALAGVITSVVVSILFVIFYVVLVGVITSSLLGSMAMY